jgi:branched-chain amino acid transport system permease protein
MIGLVQTAVTGLLLGGVMALLSCGLTLIFGVMRVTNFAQGEFVMLGMYSVALLAPLLGLAYPQFLIPAVFVVFLLFGYALYSLTMRHVTGTRFTGPRGHDAQLVVTLGLSLVLQNAALMVFGSQPHLLPTSFEGAWSVAGVLFNIPRTVGAGVALVVAGGLTWFLNCTATGKTLRATADDAEAAVYMGIDVKRVHALAFSIGTGLAGVGGAILATFYPTQPYVGEDFIVLMFVAVVLGGLGSVPGAMLGGLVIGLAQAFSPMILPFQLQNMGAFILFLLVLYLRPQGMFGRKARV